MRLPENVKISEKVPSEKKRGASYDNTSICPIIPWSENELWLTVVLEPSNRDSENHQTFNSKCDGSVVLTEGPAHFR